GDRRDAELLRRRLDGHAERRRTALAGRLAAGAGRARRPARSSLHPVRLQSDGAGLRRPGPAAALPALPGDCAPRGRPLRRAGSGGEAGPALETVLGRVAVVLTLSGTARTARRSSRGGSLAGAVSNADRRSVPWSRHPLRGVGAAG